MYEKHSLKSLLEKAGAASDGDSLSRGEFISHLDECNKKTQAAIVLRQAKDGKPAFYASRVNGFHNNLPGAIPETIGALKTVYARFADPTPKHRPPDTDKKKPPPQEVSFATLSQSQKDQLLAQIYKDAGVAPGRCTRCGGQHALKDCEASASEVWEGLVLPKHQQRKEGNGGSAGQGANTATSAGKANSGEGREQSSANANITYDDDAPPCKAYW